jgi:hypothetical protein
MEKHEHIDGTNKINAELDRIAQEDAEAEERLIASLEDDTFLCAECGNRFDIDDSRGWRGVVWICQDCLQILEHAATDEPAPLD